MFKNRKKVGKVLKIFSPPLPLKSLKTENLVTVTAKSYFWSQIDKVLQTIQLYFIFQ